ncbi:MAG: rhomboid family intramembrane serine protease [Candidatus Sericytochromatia bacterium]
MLPLHDDNPSGTTPVVTYVLIAINVVVFLYQLTLGQTGLERFFFEFGLVPREFFGEVRDLQTGQPVALNEFVPLLTNMFMHGGWLHLGGNLLFLYIFGDNVEDRLGHAQFLLFYLLGGIIASLAHAWSGPGSGIPSLGASGAIGAVLGAYIVLYPHARITTLAFLGFLITTLRVPALIFLGVWFLMQSFQGVAALGATSTVESGGTAWWAHIGGFVFGLLGGAVARAMPKRRSPHADRWYSNR